MADHNGAGDRPAKLSFASYNEALDASKGFSSYSDNVINLSDIKKKTIPENDLDKAFFDCLIKSHALDAFSKNEALIKDLGRTLNASLQSINRFADTVFYSDIFKKISDNIRESSEVFKKSNAHFADSLLLFKEAIQQAEYKGFDPEKFFHNLVAVPKADNKDLAKVLELRRNPKIQEKIFIAEVLKNKTAIYWKVELYARSRLWEANKLENGGKVEINKRTVLLSNDEFLDLQGLTPKYNSNKARKKDQLYNTLKKLDEACSSTNRFAMFRSLLEIKNGIVVEFNPIYILEYFSKGNTTLHFSAKWLFQLNDIVTLKVAQKLIDHASTSKNRQNKRHTTLGFESIFNATHVDSGLLNPRTSNLARNKTTRSIHKALHDLDASGFIEFDGWKVGRDKSIVDDEDIKLSYRSAIEHEYKVVFRIPDIEFLMKTRDRKNYEQKSNT